MTSATANANIYTVGYSSITMKFTITQSGANTGSYIADGTNSANRRIGFLNSSTSYSLTSVTGGKMVFLGPAKTLYLNIKEIGGEIITSNPNVGGCNFVIGPDVNSGPSIHGPSNPNFFKSRIVLLLAFKS